MKIIPPSFELLDSLNGAALLQKLELAGRVCYKREAKITPDSAAGFVRRILENGHESVLEHEKLTARVVCDRGALATRSSATGSPVTARRAPGTATIRWTNMRTS